MKSQDASYLQLKAQTESKVCALMGSSCPERVYRSHTGEQAGKSFPCWYWSSRLCAAEQRLARQRQGLHFLGVPAKNTHTVFVDDESDLNEFSPAQYFDTPEQLVERRFNRPRNAEVDLPHQAVERGKALYKLERYRRHCFCCRVKFIFMPRNFTGLTSAIPCIAHGITLTILSRVLADDLIFMCRRRSASYKEMSQRRERQAKLRDLYLQKVQERHIMVRPVTFVPRKLRLLLMAATMQHSLCQCLAGNQIVAWSSTG